MLFGTIGVSTFVRPHLWKINDGSTVRLRYSPADGIPPVIKWNISHKQRGDSRHIKRALRYAARSLPILKYFGLLCIVLALLTIVPLTVFMVR